MELTGKCKEDFEWYYIDVVQENGSEPDLEEFNTLPESMQYGVYVDWFRSVNILISILPKWAETKQGEPINVYEVFVMKEIHSVWGEEPEARTAAIEKANELYNESK